MSKVLWHQSGVNSKGEPFVQLFLDEQPISQFTCEEARQFALVFLESAEAAEQDAFMFHFVQEELGGTTDHARAVIVDFRKWREARGKKGPPSDGAEFVRTDKHK